MFISGTSTTRISKVNQIQTNALTKKLFNRLKLQNNEFFCLSFEYDVRHMCSVTGDTILKAFFEADPNFAQHGRGDSGNFSFNRNLQITDCVVLLRKHFFLEEYPKKKITGVQIWGPWGPGYVTTQRNHGNSSCANAIECRDVWRVAPTCINHTLSMHSAFSNLGRSKSFNFL